VAEIVNLRTARKQKARQDKEREADRNRTFHGLSKAERERSRHEAEKASLHLDAHRREKDQ
jgi:hypothetical protein